MLPHKETFNIIYTLLATVESSLLISRYIQTKQIIYSIQQEYRSCGIYLHFCFKVIIQINLSIKLQLHRKLAASKLYPCMRNYNVFWTNIDPCKQSKHGWIMNVNTKNLSLSYSCYMKSSACIAINTCQNSTCMIIPLLSFMGGYKHSQLQLVWMNSRAFFPLTPEEG